MTGKATDLFEDDPDEMGIVWNGIQAAIGIGSMPKCSGNRPGRNKTTVREMTSLCCQNQPE